MGLLYNVLSDFHRNIMVYGAVGRMRNLLCAGS